jgi:hypothetical protein
VTPTQNSSFVETTQVAPTVLRLLGLNPHRLEAVRIEGTRVLPGIAGHGDNGGDQDQQGEDRARR